MPIIRGYFPDTYDYRKAVTNTEHELIAWWKANPSSNIMYCTPDPYAAKRIAVWYDEEKVAHEKGSLRSLINHDGGGRLKLVAPYGIRASITADVLIVNDPFLTGGNMNGDFEKRLTDNLYHVIVPDTIEIYTVNTKKFKKIVENVTEPRMEKIRK